MIGNGLLGVKSFFKNMANSNSNSDYVSEWDDAYNKAALYCEGKEGLSSVLDAIDCMVRRDIQIASTSEVMTMIEEELVKRDASVPKDKLDFLNTGVEEMFCKNYPHRIESLG